MIKRAKHTFVTFKDEIRQLTILIITCAIAYGVRGVMTLVLRRIGTLTSATNESQIA